MATIAAPVVIAPRAVPAGGSAVARLGAQVWAALEAVGRARAAGQLTRLARHYDVVDPARARQLRDAIGELV
jgi:hypothetical protein